MKRCSKCKTQKPYTEFYKSSTRKDGFQPYCKTCKQSYYNKDEMSTYNKIYRKNNKERKRELDRQWRNKNKEKCKIYSREYRKHNPEAARKSVAKYKASHPEIFRKKERKRRAKKKSISESYSVSDEQYTKELFDNKCVNCGSVENLCIDHHKPLSKGNALTRQNAVVLCRTCNSSKSNKDPEDFYNINKLSWISEKLEGATGIKPVSAGLQSAA